MRYLLRYLLRREVAYLMITATAAFLLWLRHSGYLH